MENYIVNKDGSVWSNLSNKFLKPEKTANGTRKTVGGFKWEYV